MSEGQKRREQARALAHAVLREMRLPCGFLAEERDEGDGWVRMPTPHALDCDRVVAVIEAFARGPEADENEGSV